jgi:serine/threonine protein kinase
MFSRAITRYMLHQVALGCLALSRAGIVHRDLAARNLLVDSQLQVKVADYGLSRDVDEDRNYYRLTTERLIPMRWTAPESVVSLKWTSASDCYSYGIVVFEMFTFGEFPFNHIADGPFVELLASEKALHRELLGQIGSTLAKHGVQTVPLIVETLVSRCVVRKPGDRPTFEELAQLTRRSTAVYERGTPPLSPPNTHVSETLLPPPVHRNRAPSLSVQRPAQHPDQHV